MRQEFLNCETREEALERAPWACIIVSVFGGYMAFESKADYITWMNQR